MEFVKNSFQALLEAADTELLEMEDPEEEDDIEEFEDEYDDIEELEDDLECTVEMVNVVEDYNSVTSSSRYLVEMGDLCRYMESSTITDVEGALRNIAYENTIDINDMWVVVESQGFMDEMILEAKKQKKSGSNKKLKDINTASKMFKLMKTKGIKLAKKKSKDFKASTNKSL